MIKENYTCFVYLQQEESLDAYYKIGYSGNPKKRRMQNNTGNVRLLKVISLIECADNIEAYELESYLKWDLFAAYNTGLGGGTEWFYPVPEILDYFINHEHYVSLNSIESSRLTPELLEFFSKQRTYKSKVICNKSVTNIDDIIQLAKVNKLPNIVPDTRAKTALQSQTLRNFFSSMRNTTDASAKCKGRKGDLNE